MIDRLRRIVLSIPVATAAGLVVLYLLAGYFAVPALVKWQAEKQVREQLGHTLSLGAVRFDPLAFEFEIRDVALTDTQGQPMFGLRRVFADFELWRSLLDGAWTFAAASVEAPALHFELDNDGRHNFSALAARLAGGGVEQERAAALPRLAIGRAVLTDGRIEVLDRALAQPRITLIEPVTVTLDGLSTGDSSAGRFTAKLPSAAGEVFEAHGELSLNPVLAKGQATVSGLQVATLVRALSRWLAVDAPAGQIDAGGRFDVGIDDNGQFTGTAQDIDFGVAALSLSAPDAKAPLLALQQVALTGGRIDFGQREVAFANLKLGPGRIAASTDERGDSDWSTLMRSRAEPVKPAAAPPQRASSLPWHLRIASADVAAIALGIADAQQARSAQIDAVALSGAPSAEVGAAGFALRLDKPALSLAGLRLEQPDGAVKASDLSLVTDHMSLATTDDAVAVEIDAMHLKAVNGLSLTQGQDALAATGASLQTGPVTMRSAGTNTDGAFGALRLALSGVSLTQPGQGATLNELSVEGEAAKLRSTPAQLAIDLTGLRGQLAGLQAGRGEDSLALRTAALALDKLSLGRDNTDLRVALDAPALSTTGARLGRGAQANGSSDGLEWQDADLGAQALSLTLSQGQLQVVGNAATASLNGLAARRSNERLNLGSAAFEARTVSADTGGAAQAPSSPEPGSAAERSAAPAGTTGAMQARLEDAALRIEALSVAASGSTSDIGQLGAAKLTAKSLRMTQPEGPLDLAGDGLGAELTNALLRDPRDATEVLRLGRTALTGASLRLRERQLSAETLALAQGDVQTWLDGDGRFNLLSMFGATTPPDAPAPAASESAVPWRVALAQAQVDELAVGFEDRAASPAFALRLDPIRARASAIDSASQTPMQLEAQATIASGGDVRIDGSARADGGAAELNVELSGIALAPIQTYLSQFADLKLNSGAASSKGRLRYGDAVDGVRLAYEGNVKVERLLLEEAAAQRPFLSWDSVASDDVVLTLEPNRADIGELRVDKPEGRLIIAADQSVNLSDVLKKKSTSSAAGAVAKASESADLPRHDEPFPVSIARVRVAEGLLEFADLSLRPQFATRMHDLKGVITGLGTDASRSANVQLDAQVDRYGSARIRGQLSVLEPERLTDIEMTFRNLEMTSLSPYVAKFAGYKVAGGRLALDLQYKVRQSKLLGTNKIVLSQVALGEKVESPDALDLPLELAIAILQDSKGVIDIGLPVSGDLSDPKFDYGAVIGKAVGNLLGGIVTAPFKALGALLDGGDQKSLGTVAFEPGSDALAPPERQKLAALARALQQRPALSMVVPPIVAKAQDTAALKSLAVRRDIVERMGVALAAGEDPGPIDVANARTERAIEGAFSARYAPEVLAALKRRAVQTRVAAADDVAAAPGAVPAAGSPPSAPAAGPPPDFYQGLVERLIREQPVTDDQLLDLARRRAQAVVQELTVAGGVAGSRVTVGEPQQSKGADQRVVALQLELKASP